MFPYCWDHGVTQRIEGVDEGRDGFPATQAFEIGSSISVVGSSLLGLIQSIEGYHVISGYSSKLWQSREGHQH